MTDTYAPLVRRTEHVLRPDPARVVSTMFLPGQEFLTAGESRSTDVLERVLALDEAAVARTLERTLTSFGSRHHDLERTLARRFELVAHRLADSATVSAARRLLIGAYFSQEYAVEAAALLNPSMVAHPDQSGLPDGSVRFVMSARAVGEGHLSSIELRSGVIDTADHVHVDTPSGPTREPRLVSSTFSSAVFAQQLAELGGDLGDADFVLDGLPALFARSDLDAALTRLRGQRLTRGRAARTAERFERIAACNYTVEFAAGSPLDARVIMPRSPSESHGLEDLRLVRFTDDDGRVDYRGTYTAYDGTHVVPQLVTSPDLRTFTMSQLSGPAAKNKGMALFPRKVGGRYLALSRWDRESNALAASDDLSHWSDATTLEAPLCSWEIVQVGNCGPPIETPAGWVVLTHGVGPVREYAIGAMLLDRADPRRVLGRLPEPLLRARPDERDGYVPNVVYSCGGLRHGDTVVLPYGCSDSSIRIALLDLPGLVGALVESGRRSAPRQNPTDGVRQAARVRPPAATVG